LKVTLAQQQASTKQHEVTEKKKNDSNMLRGRNTSEIVSLWIFGNYNTESRRGWGGEGKMKMDLLR
jgi:hypothetical protein